MAKVFLIPFFNAYRGYAGLVAHGSSRAEMLLSKEGVAQGDTLSMLPCAAAIMPLVQSVSHE